jgi:phage gp46-like protein
MSDIKIILNEDYLEGDFVFESNDLATDLELHTAVLISLFTDRRAADDDTLPDPSSSDKRGWWGDLNSPDVTGDQIGSRLWLLSREKATMEVVRRAEQYAKESLQWLIEDGVAATVNVTAERVEAPLATLALKVEILKSNGVTEAMEFSIKWDELGG